MWRLRALLVKLFTNWTLFSSQPYPLDRKAHIYIIPMLGNSLITQKTTTYQMDTLQITSHIYYLIHTVICIKTIRKPSSENDSSSKNKACLINLFLGLATRKY